jgi:hypothetical protein
MALAAVVSFVPRTNSVSVDPYTRLTPRTGTDSVRCPRTNSISTSAAIPERSADT